MATAAPLNCVRLAAGLELQSLAASAQREQLPALLQALHSFLATAAAAAAARRRRRSSGGDSAFLPPDASVLFQSVELAHGMFGRTLSAGLPAAGQNLFEGFDAKGAPPATACLCVVLIVPEVHCGVLKMFGHETPWLHVACFLIIALNAVLRLLSCSSTDPA